LHEEVDLGLVGPAFAEKDARVFLDLAVNDVFVLELHGPGLLQAQAQIDQTGLRQPQRKSPAAGTR